MRLIWRFFVFGAFAAVAIGVASRLVLVRQERAFMGKQPDGSHLVSTGQALTPNGKLVRIEGARPKDLAVSPSGDRVAALCNGRVSIFTIEGDPVGEVNLRTAAMGIAWGPNGEVYASNDRGGIARIGQTNGKWEVQGTFPAAFPEGVEPSFHGGNPQILGLAAYNGGKELFAVLGRWNQVLRKLLPWEAPFDKAATLGGFPTDVAPYGVVTDGRYVAVANRGGEGPKAGEAQAESSGTKAAIDAETDAAAHGSLTIWDSETRSTERVETGRQPSGMCFSPDGTVLAVANSDSDSVSLVDIASKKVTQAIGLWPEQEQIFGHIPTDVAWSDDGKRLFVACGGINAIAVLDMAGLTPKLMGHIPTAWFPISVRQAGGQLIVACSKGVGSRPASKTTKYGVHDNVGALQFFRVEDALRDLPGLSRRVASNNRWGRELSAREGQRPVPIPERVGGRSVFKHVVYVIKENLTYDAVLGDLEIGNGDKSLCMFPEEVSPNHHALAREFVLLDNTYTSGTNSADGHQWTSSSLANAYTEQNYAATIRSYPYDGGDPLAFSPAGFLWTAAKRKGISVRVYGEFVDKPVVRDPSTGKMPSWKQLWDDYKAGGTKYEIRAETSQAALRPVLHPRFIGFPSQVCDQWRADQFLAELKDWDRTGRMPALSVMLFPNDHTAGTTPGMPTPQSMVADNDLALGRIVEAISKSRFWKETLILVIEDDSQLGVDHVDGHRTAAFCISPYTRRGAVVSEPYNHTSFVRTMGLVLGFPALNRFDRAATPLTACFQASPDMRPYICKPSVTPLDTLNPKASKLKGQARELALASARLDWSDVDRADATTVAKAVWSVTRPGEPFPEAKFSPNKDDD